MTRTAGSLLVVAVTAAPGPAFAACGTVQVPAATAAAGDRAARNVVGS